mgnify:CR=1 FL=1
MSPSARPLATDVSRRSVWSRVETLLPALGDYEIEFDRVVRLRTEFVQGYGSLPIRFEASA